MSEPVIPERAAQIAKLNAAKKHGHVDSAVQHADELLTFLRAAEAKVAEQAAEIAALRECVRVRQEEIATKAATVAAPRKEMRSLESALQAAVEVKNDKMAEQAATIERLTRTLQSINRMLSPGSRTMDEMLRDMGCACDCARAALNPPVQP